MSFWDKFKSLFKRNNDVASDSVVPVDSLAGSLNDGVVPVEQDVTVESLAKEQEVIDKLYEAEGLSDRVLEMQVALNQKRNKYDISDKNNLNSEGWSQ